MIEITRIDNPKIGARIIDIDKYSKEKLKAIMDFWQSKDDYYVKIHLD